MTRQKLSVAVVVSGLMLSMVLSGCDGGGGGGVGNGGGDGTAQTQASTSSLNVINRVLDILLGDDSSVTRGEVSETGMIRQAQTQATTRQEPVSVTLACSSGQVSFSGEALVVEGVATDSFSIDGTITFSNCEGINGSVSLASSGTVSSSQITLGITLNGTLSAEGCSIGFAQFSADTTANLSGTLTSPIIVNGTVNASCEGERVACTLDNVNLDDQQAFEQSCTAA